MATPLLAAFLVLAALAVSHAQPLQTTPIAATETLSYSEPLAAFNMSSPFAALERMMEAMQRSFGQLTQSMGSSFQSGGGLFGSGGGFFFQPCSPPSIGDDELLVRCNVTGYEPDELKVGR